MSAKTEPTGQLRPDLIHVRCTTAEKELIEKMATLAGARNVSAFIRKKCGIPEEPVKKYKLIIQ